MATSYYNHHYNKLGQNTFFALGGDSNYYPCVINAENDVIGSTQEDIWSVGGELTYLSSAETMEISSTDTNDTSAGTGARTVKITGLNGSWAETTETVTMNGTTDVTTSNSYLRIHKLEVVTGGSGGKNAGTITAVATTAATTQQEIPIGYNRSMSSHFTVPAGKKAVLQSMHASLPIKKSGGIDQEDALIHLEARLENGVFRKYISTYASYGAVSFDSPAELCFVEKTDLRLVGVRVDDVDARVTGTYTLLIIDDSIIT